METIGLIGLGLVGTALSQRFGKAGYSVCGYDIQPERCRALQEAGFSIADSPSSIALACQRIILSLPDSNCVETVLFGSCGIFSSNESSLFIIDTTTGSPAKTMDIAERVKKHKSRYIDACIVGSSTSVAEGQVVVSAGGDRQDVEAQQDLFSTFAKHVFYMGENGKGIQAKLVVNLVLGLNRLVLAEGLRFAEVMQFNLEDILSLLKAGASYSKVMDTKGPKMIAGDFLPEARLAQHLKDVDLILQTAREKGVQLDLSRLHQQVLNKGLELNLGDLDNSAVIEILRQRDD